MATTTIQVSGDVWEKLNRLKTKDEKTFEEVIMRLIKNNKEESESK